MMLALWMAVTLRAALAARVFESRPRNLHGGVAGDDLEALHHARDHFMLQAGVEVLGVLAEDRQVDGHVAESGSSGRAACAPAGN